MLAQKISSHLKKLCQTSPAINRQFAVDETDLLSTDDEPPSQNFSDPLLEEEFEKCKGLIHKYDNRVLILLTLACAAYCRFCTRQRKVSDIQQGNLTKADLENMLSYIKSQPQISEVILSGGDPLVVPKKLIYALNKFSALEQIKNLRIGTRVPVAAPELISTELLTTIKEINKPVYVGIHFEHPDEITTETQQACKQLRQAGAILYSQSVFLKNINDDEETLYKLFSELITLGVRPYYIYHCDPVIGAEKFQVPVSKEISIMTNLRKRLSGLAYPTYVIDTPNGSGKIPVPLDFWRFDKEYFYDFLGEKIKI